MRAPAGLSAKAGPPGTTLGDLMTRNPTTSPTPETTYEPRIWAGRIFTKDDPFVGTPFVFKAPYGVYMNALQLLGRAVATRQIVRFTFGPLSATGFKKLDRRDLVRYEEAFDRLSLQLGINWSA